MDENQSLDPRLRAKLKSLEMLPERDSQAVEDGRAKFLSQAQSLAAPVSVAGDQRHNTWMQSKLKKKEKRSMLSTLASIFVALTLAFGGAGATVYASQDSLPDDFLYPVKIFSEDLQLTMLNGDQEKFNALLNLAERRWDEISDLMNAGEPVPEQTATRLELHIRTMLKLAEGMGDDAMQGAMLQIQTMLQQHEQVRAMLQTQNPELGERLMEQIQTMLQEHQGDGPNGDSDGDGDGPNGPHGDGDGDGDGPNGPNGDGDGDGPNGPNGDGDGDGDGPNGPNGDGDGDGDGPNGPNGDGDGDGDGPNGPSGDGGNGP